MVWRMTTTSPTYDLFAQAMRARTPVRCMYDGHGRDICPIILGHTEGLEKALVFQFSGSGSKGTVRGHWKCFTLSKVKRAKLIDGPWQAEAEHKSAQSCVQDVDLDVNPASPYSPKRRL
jgi:hypothetical protein